jgi:hypothetical protein
MSTSSKLGYAALALAVLLGLAGVFGLIDPLLAAIVAAVAIVLLLPGTFPRLDLILVRTLGAALLGILSLAGVNFLAHHLGLGHLWIPLGLVLAMILLAGVAYFYLHHNGWSPLCAGVGAGLLAFGLIVAAPYGIGKLKESRDPVPVAERVASKLNVAIVSDGSRHGAQQLPPNPGLEEFDVRYSVGFAAGNAVRWTLLDGEDPEEALRVLARGDAATVLPGAPAPEPDADSAVVLLVDGTAPVVEDPTALKSLDAFDRQEVRRWREVAVSAGAPAVPAFALLQTTGRRRLRGWRPFGRRESIVSVQALGSQAATDAAVRLAVAAPTSEEDFALAMAYRPILLFDRKEPVPWPLSVGALFRQGAVTLCRDQGVAKSECDSEPLRRPAELESPGTHLRLDIDSDALKGLAERELAAQRGEAAGPTLPPDAGQPPAGTPPASAAPPDAGAPPGAGSTIYVHPTSSSRDGRDLLFLDYWWYLPQNPVGLGGGALCGAGFVIPGVTCQSHESDWEGVTVVVDRTNQPRIEAVQYAQHDSVIRYEWAQLRNLWAGDPRVQGLVEGIDDAGERPLVFVAAGTHASYPTPCASGCQQVANSGLDEDQHRGNLGWIGNDTGSCGASSCLQMLPTRAGGAKPALWNAFEGPWGERHCFLSYYCDSGTPPSAPGQQKRYQHPGRYSGYVDARGRFRREQFED